GRRAGSLPTRQDRAGAVLWPARSGRSDAFRDQASCVPNRAVSAAWRSICTAGIPQEQTDPDSEPMGHRAVRPTNGLHIFFLFLKQSTLKMDSGVAASSNSAVSQY